MRTRNDPLACLLEARLEAGLTQEELAAKAGLSVRTVANIEHGRVHWPRASSVRLLCQALGFSRFHIEDLLRRRAQGALDGPG